jgi:hypothetical protein
MKIISYGIIAAAASALITGIAFAQDPQEITIQATRNLNVKADVHTLPGDARIKDISLSYAVNSAGLNLALYADVLTLEQRVKDASLAACKEIGHQYPYSMPNDADCAKATADKAMVRVNELVAAAEKKPAK